MALGGLQQLCLHREATAWSLLHRHACDLPWKQLCREGVHVSLFGLRAAAVPLCHCRIHRWMHQQYCYAPILERPAVLGSDGLLL